MRRLLYLFCLLMLAVLPGWSQKHEVGAMGGFVLGGPVGQVNGIYGGGEGGAYYRYVPNKWIGLQGRLNYQYLVEDSGNWGKMRHSVVVPLRAVVFPKFRFSVVGGLFVRQVFGEAKVIYEKPSKSGDVAIWGGQFHFSKRPAFGYEAGVAWNHRHWRLVLSLQKEFSSWMSKKEYDKVSEHGIYLWASRPRSATFHLALEVPLWRGRK